MSERTIPGIEGAFAEKAAEIVRGWHETQDEITRSEVAVEGGYSEYLTDGGRAQVAREHKAERAAAKAEEHRQEYTKLTRERNAAVKARTHVLRDELFGVEDAGALARVALASDADLRAMLELAVHAGNNDLARSVFVAADQRELGDVLSTYFERVDPEAGELYQEWRAAPSEEDLERRLADAETIFSAPDASYFATAGL
jgi:hypothetical protein